MITSVRLQKFRGFDDVTIPLTRVTMLTGANGIGKTSVLEGLYCLFSETRLDVRPFCRYDRIETGNEYAPGPAEFPDRRFDYAFFWDDCMAFGGRSCSVSAESDDGTSRTWSCAKRGMFGLDDDMKAEARRSRRADSTSRFAVFDWELRWKHDNRDPIRMSKSQILSSRGGLLLLPDDAPETMPSACVYVDYSSVRVPAAGMPFLTARKLAGLLHTIDKRVSDIRVTLVGRGQSVILNDSHEISLAALGSGAVSWIGTLVAVMDAAERYDQYDLSPAGSAPVFVLVDEIGAGMHHKGMEDIWRFFRDFADDHPYIQFVITTHSNDCVRAFCNVFNKEGDSASVVTMHKNFLGEFGVIQLTHPDFENIVSGDWEVRG
ncbi:MAG: ATP-binding protein [Polyangiaceae bacterium]|nr:ATP-binding protein [Polyangiaceae bacterium]